LLSNKSNIIHWDSTVSSIQRLSDSLELTSSFSVFIDDNPEQCLAVKTVLPEVLDTQIPNPAHELLSLLRHHWAPDVLVHGADFGG